MYHGQTNGMLTVGKALAQVYLGSLTQTYDGSAKVATATTDPSGLMVAFTYNGSGIAPSNVGVYAVTGTLVEPNYQGSTNGLLTIQKAGQTIAFGLIPDQETTNVVILGATASSGLDVNFTVANGPAQIVGGTTMTFTNAGMVSVVANQAGNENWDTAPAKTNTFVVSRTLASVTLDSLSQTYDGTPRMATAATVPAGLTVDLTYGGSPMAPTNAGSYAVTGTVNSAMYQGRTNGMLVVGKALAQIHLGSLTRTYDGGTKSATATTEPSDLTVTFTYDGSAIAPSNAGTYAVIGTVVEHDYQGSTNGLLTIQKADQTITFDPIATQLESNRLVLAATASSGLPVSFATNSGPALITNGTNLSFTGGGGVSLVASQGGNDNYNAAPDVTNMFTVLALFHLTIQSEHGTATPATGTYTYVVGTVITNVMVNPGVSGTTQYVCSGWAMSGNGPASGTGKRVIMTITNNAVLTWVWTTYYWIDTEAGTHGSVNIGDGWQKFGSSVLITPTADPHYHFTNWSGDADGDADPLEILMDGPKVVAANFAENRTVNTDTPEWWLAKYYPGTNDYEAAALSDTDGDGVPAWLEWIALTSPTNGLDYLKVETVGHVVNGNTVKFFSHTNRLYSVESATNLVTHEWGPVTSNVEGTESICTVTNVSYSPSMFYRVRVNLK